jgi:hypothetical protein
MARVGYFIKNVRTDGDVTGDTTGTAVNATKVNEASPAEYMFYAWPSSQTIGTAASTQAALAALALKAAYPQMMDTVRFNLILAALTTVNTEVKVTDSTTGKFVFRYGKQVYALGYTYSSSLAINPATSTQTYKV